MPYATAWVRHLSRNTGREATTIAPCQHDCQAISVWITYEDAILELHASDFQRLEELWNSLSVRLRIYSRTRRRDLCRCEVGDVNGWLVHKLGVGHREEEEEGGR